MSKTEQEDNQEKLTDLMLSLEGMKSIPEDLIKYEIMPFFIHTDIKHYIFFNHIFPMIADDFKTPRPPPDRWYGYSGDINKEMVKSYVCYLLKDMNKKLWLKPYDPEILKSYIKFFKSLGTPEEDLTDPKQAIAGATTDLEREIFYMIECMLFLANSS